jgi:hypothetical protein
MSEWEVKSATKVGDKISIILEQRAETGDGGAVVGFILAMWFMHLFDLHGFGWGFAMWLVGLLLANLLFWPSIIVAGIIMVVFFTAG